MLCSIVSMFIVLSLPCDTVVALQALRLRLHTCSVDSNHSEPMVVLIAMLPFIPVL